jgi:hypothetical protein
MTRVSGLRTARKAGLRENPQDITEASSPAFLQEDGGAARIRKNRSGARTIISP